MQLSPHVLYFASTILLLTTAKLLISHHPVVASHVAPDVGVYPSVYLGCACLFFILIMHASGIHTNQVHLQMSFLHGGLSDRGGDAVPPREGSKIDVPFWL